MIEKYDVAILGGGLSALTAILKIIDSNPNLKICVLSSNYSSYKGYLTVGENIKKIMQKLQD